MAETTQSAFAHDLLRQCRKTLGGSNNGLTGIIEAHEQDFLSLGEELYALQQSCEDISRTAQSLVSYTSGQAMHTTLSALSQELEALTDDTARASGRQSLEEIDGVVRIVDELSDILSAFSKIVKYLSILGIATRIESARLGNDGRGFTTLADDVEKLAHQIVEHCAGIAGRIETLRGHVQSARQRNLAILGTQEQCHEVIVRQLAANIVALGEMASSSSEISLGLSRTAEEIARDIGQAVRSMQSHDIVRQQVEHAEHALAETAEMLDLEVTDEADAKTVLELLAFVADVFTLETSQIASADEHFTNAADTLRNSLTSLAGRIRGIGETIAGRTGAGTADTPLTRLEAGVVTVKSELGDFAAAGEALGTIMDSVADTIAGMGGAIEAIEEVGTEIELIAINASIKAAHTGEAGAALGVLALAIQRLSGDARRQTDAVARILGDIASASTRLQDNAGRYNDQSEAWRIIGELDAVLTDTSATTQQCQELFASLSGASRTWGDRADELSRNIDFDREIGRSFSGIRRSLDEQIAAARKLVPSGGKGRSNRLRQLYDRYTMEAERDVHEAAFGQSQSKLAAKPQAKAFSQEPTEFGDNVELF
ncbi:methyl-accepting chemotaxis protein [Desulfovibrio sp. TomC]|uniref:methyl-accepting chemotaxis protein n=1 Tax=Desulfovibrio sp. TomC TaxID=1562888 RepID=UPI000574050D|nr:methyl-accepting chemotaxis protein [Desulfovibrio sp. TomC]KHK04367.1 Methyl-accepting chemotaxis protein [Desulfovibrio sp. TomC]